MQQILASSASCPEEQQQVERAMILKAEACHRDIWKCFVHLTEDLYPLPFPCHFIFHIYHAPAVLSTLLFI